MQVSRIARAINWKHALGEFLLIFVGILAAFEELAPWVDGRPLDPAGA